MAGSLCLHHPVLGRDAAGLKPLLQRPHRVRLVVAHVARLRLLHLVVVGRPRRAATVVVAIIPAAKV